MDISVIRKRFSEILKNSYYRKLMIGNKGAIVFALLIACFLTFLAYPGVMYTDSYARINMAENIKQWLQLVLSGNRASVDAASWITVVPSYFIGLSTKLVGSVALFTFVQVFLLYMICFAISKKLLGDDSPWMVLYILLTPVFAAFSVYYEASVGCLIGIIAVIFIIWDWDNLTEKTIDRVVTYLFLVLCSFVVFGFRANAISILPALILIVLLRAMKMNAKVGVIVGILVGALLVPISTTMLNIDTMSSSTAGLVWEMVSTIQSMDEDKQAKYANYLDDIFEEGTTRAALEVNIYEDPQVASVNPILWDVLTIEKVSEPGQGKLILAKYFDLVKNEPKAFFKTKWTFVSNTLGMKMPINMWEYYYNRDDRMADYGFNDSLPRLHFVNYVLAYMGFAKVYRMPWLMFLVGLILIGVRRYLNHGLNERITVEEAMYLIAIFYYGAYVLDTQSFEFRYFFPSWVLLAFVIISSLMELSKNNKNLKYCIRVGLIIISIVLLIGGYHQLQLFG